MQSQIHNDIGSCSKITAGLQEFVRKWKNEKMTPHPTVGVNLYQCLRSIGDMLEYMSKSHFSSDEVWYTLYDLSLVLRKADSLVRKYYKAAGRILGKQADYIKQVAVMCNRLYVIHQLFTFFATQKYSFRASTVITDKDAASFWNQSFGDTWWYKDYESFTEAIKRANGNAYLTLKKAFEPGYKDRDGLVKPRVVTAIRFAMLTDEGFSSFCKGAAKKNPLLVPDVTKGVPFVAPESDSGKKSCIESGRNSEYFYILSECRLGEQPLCLQVSSNQKNNNNNHQCSIVPLIIFITLL